MRFSIVLCRSITLSSWLLRFFMWSRWSHSAILDHRTGTVYDSTFIHGGCKTWDAKAFFRMHSTMELRPIEIASGREDDAVQWLEAQTGKPYDWTALLGFVLRRDWQRDDAWFCSEETETFRSTFGVPRFRLGAGRVTPGHQDMIV